MGRRRNSRNNRRNQGRKPFGQPSGKDLKLEGRTLHLPENTNQAPGTDIRGYTCQMSSKKHGGKLMYDFDPDPISVLWGMNANINLLLTRGGQVAYASGRQIGPVTIVGYVRSRWDLLDLGEFIYRHMEEAMIDGHPLRFTYPERELDFSMMVQAMTPIGLDSAEGELAGYTLTCVITEDHTAVKTTKMSGLMPALPENIEWIDVENAAKIAEKRFGEMLFGAAGEGMQEGQDGDENKSPDEEDVVPGSSPGSRGGQNNEKDDPTNLHGNKFAGDNRLTGKDTEDTPYSVIRDWLAKHANNDRNETGRAK